MRWRTHSAGEGAPADVIAKCRPGCEGTAPTNHRSSFLTGAPTYQGRCFELRASVWPFCTHRPPDPRHSVSSPGRNTLRPRVGMILTGWTSTIDAMFAGEPSVEGATSTGTNSHIPRHDRDSAATSRRALSREPFEKTTCGSTCREFTACKSPRDEPSGIQFRMPTTCLYNSSVRQELTACS